MIFVWCTCVYKCVHLFCTGTWWGQRTTSTVIPRALLAFTALLAFYLFSVCVQMHVPCHKYGRGAKRTGKWGQMSGFSTEGPTSHHQQHCKEESISKDLNWQLRVNSVGKITSPKVTERQVQDRETVTESMEAAVSPGHRELGTALSNLCKCRGQWQGVRYSSAALKCWFHRNCSS